MDERDGEKQRRRACLERSPRGPRHSGGRSLFPESVGEYLAQRGFDPCVARAASRIGRSGVPKQHPEGTGVGDGAGGGRTHCWRPQRRRGFRPRHQPPARAARRPGASESTARGGVRTCAAPHAAARRQGTHWGRRWRRARAEDGLRVPDHWEALQQPGKGGGKAVHVRDLRQRARRRRHRCGPAGWKMENGADAPGRIFAAGRFWARLLCAAPEAGCVFFLSAAVQRLTCCVAHAAAEGDCAGAGPPPGLCRLRWRRPRAHRRTCERQNPKCTTWSEQ